MRRVAFLLRVSPVPSIALTILLSSICTPNAGAAAARGHARPRHRACATAPSAHAPRAAAPVFLPGMVVAIDPETGALVLPTPEQRLALQSVPGSALTPAERTGLMRTSAGLTEQHLPDGTVRVDLQGRFREFATISVASGRPSFACVHDSTTLRRILDAHPAADGAQAPAPTPAFEER